MIDPHAVTFRLFAVIDLQPAVKFLAAFHSFQSGFKYFMICYRSKIESGFPHIKRHFFRREKSVGTGAVGVDISFEYIQRKKILFQSIKEIFILIKVIILSCPYSDPMFIFPFEIQFKRKDIAGEGKRDILPQMFRTGGEKCHTVICHTPVIPDIFDTKSISILKKNLIFHFKNKFYCAVHLLYGRRHIGN